MNEHYSMLIQWSDEDQAYLVTLPEWADRVQMPCADGATYEEAARAGAEMLDELHYLIEQGHILIEQGHILIEQGHIERPAPRVYAAVG